MDTRVASPVTTRNQLVHSLCREFSQSQLAVQKYCCLCVLTAVIQYYVPIITGLVSMNFNSSLSVCGCSLVHTLCIFQVYVCRYDIVSNSFAHTVHMCLIICCIWFALCSSKRAKRRILHQVWTGPLPFKSP